MQPVILLEIFTVAKGSQLARLPLLQFQQHTGDSLSKLNTET